MKNALVDETALTNRYPILKTFRSLNEKHECVFKSPYGHLNNLLKFTNDVHFDILHEPSPCTNRSDSRPLIVFGIKSMPHTAAMRSAIRDTWLDKNYWNSLGVNIHIVFLTGSSGNSWKFYTIIWPKFWLVDESFDFWIKFWFFRKFSIFDQNINSWLKFGPRQKIIFWQKKNVILVKNENGGKKRNFGQKLKWW